MEYFLLAVLVLFLYMHFETRKFAVSYVDVNKENGAKNETFTTVHLSDLHFCKMFVNVNKVISVIRNANPDCIFLSGDYVSGRRSVARFLRFIEALTGLNVPVFVVWGNHEHKIFRSPQRLDDFRKAIDATGAKVLVNESALVRKDDLVLKVIGLDDLVYGSDAVEGAFDEKAFDEEGKEEGFYTNRVVLTHNPDMIYKVKDKDFDIMLCGHFHGGQIYMPFHFEFRLLRNERICKEGFIKGLHFVEGHYIYINRGLGNVSFPFRFLSTPEVAVIRLY